MIWILLFPAILLAQTTWYVPDDFTNIQDAIDDASVVNGDTIMVRPGTYKEIINFWGKAVALVSEAGSEATVLDGDLAGPVLQCWNNEDENTVVEGFTVTNGRGYNLGHVGLVGGGMYNYGSSPTVTDCFFTENTADRGGAMMNYNLSSPALTRCTFIENSAYIAGAIVNWEYSAPTITHCSFIDNSAILHYGAMYNQRSSPSLYSCVFVGNTAGTSTGAMHNTFSSAPTVANCTFYGNSAANAGAVSDNSSGIATLYANCIFWNNSPTQIETYEATPLVTYCCVEGGWPGAGNIDSDPLFVDAASNDLHLTYPSPCRNTGHNAAAVTTADFEGDARVTYGTVDMGADEFHPHLYYTGDATPGGSIAAKLVGEPGTNPVALLLGSGVTASPQGTAWGDFFLQAPWWIYWLVPIPADGILSLPASVPLSPGAPYDVPMQGLIGLEPDSLSNVTVLKIR